jgi:hypothetical protein
MLLNRYNKMKRFPDGTFQLPVFINDLAMSIIDDVSGERMATYHADGQISLWPGRRLT